jgi:hypothetical protein
MYKPAIETLNALGEHSVSIDNVVNVSEIPYNSTFIWVGVHNVQRVPWKQIRARGAKTVYYQTERVNSCALTKSNVDEIWDYAWYNIEQCKGKRDAPVLRYVPIARQLWAKKFPYCNTLMQWQTRSRGTMSLPLCRDVTRALQFAI